MTDAIQRMIEEEDQHVQVAETAIAAITRSEVEAQLTAAHRFPRSVSKFLKKATTLATITREVAESCIYSVPRDGKMITGPSVRLAEIAASSYGNLHFGARVVDVGETDITAQGIAWDLEGNVRVTVETKRRITSRNGRRFSDDMIVMTGNAACSIALRNALFRVIPRAYIDGVYQNARALAVGDAKSLADRRADFLARLAKLGVSQERVLLRLSKTGVEDIGVEDLEVLIGLGNSIRSGELKLDDAFPSVAPAVAAPAQDGQRIKMGPKKDAPQGATGPAAPMREPGDD